MVVSIQVKGYRQQSGFLLLCPFCVLFTHFLNTMILSSAYALVKLRSFIPHSLLKLVLHLRGNENLVNLLT